MTLAAQLRSCLPRHELLPATFWLIKVLASSPASLQDDAAHTRGFRMFLREFTRGTLKPRLRMDCYVAQHATPLAERVPVKEAIESAQDVSACTSTAPRAIKARRWDSLRHRAVDFTFGRMFRAVAATLCEPRSLPTRGIHRVLVCRPNHRLGNAVLISSLLAEVEALYPGAEIDLVSGGDAAQSLFTDRFQVRRVFCLPRKIARHLWYTIGLLRQLRGNSYDLAIDACNGSQSGRLLLAIVKARFKLGFPDEATSATSAWHQWSCPPHLAQRSVLLLRAAYAGKIDRSCFPLNLRLSDDEKKQSQRALEAVIHASHPLPGQRPVVGIFANATGAKRYGEQWWVQFVGKLQAALPDVLIVDVLAEHGHSQLGGEFASYYTRDLRRLASVISNMDAFVSADCGVMHLAAASGTPTLGLFSVTCPTKYGPFGLADAAVDTTGMTAVDVASVVSDWLSASALKAATPQGCAKSPTDRASREAVLV